MYRLQRAFVGGLMAMLLHVAYGTAVAQSCSLAASTINYGVVSPISGATTPGQSTVTINCTGFATPYVRACANLGDDTTTPRLMTGPSSATMRHDLFQDAARTIVWGSAYHGNLPLYIDIALSGGAGSGQKTFYGSVFANQTASPPGTYSGTTTSAIMFSYPYSTTPPTCTTSGYTHSASFQVGATATVSSDCNVSATNIDFGSIGLIDSPVNSTGMITATCTTGTNYAVALSAGQGAGATVAARSMTRGGGESLAYALYRDSGRTQPWGDGGSGTGTVAGTGTGSAQTITVYATLPAQPAPPPGSYSDTIIVTVTY